MIDVLMALVLAARPEGSPHGSVEQCRSRADVVAQIVLLRQAPLALWTPQSVGHKWGPLRVAGTAGGWPTIYRRDRLAIDEHVECGEAYQFDVNSQRPPFRDQLRQVTVIHAEQTRADALVAAKAIGEAVAAPPGARASSTVCWDCGNRGERLLDVGWDADDRHVDVQLFVLCGSERCRLRLQWWEWPR